MKEWKIVKKRSNEYGHYRYTLYRRSFIFWEYISVKHSIEDLEEIISKYKKEKQIKFYR